ncbi:hypothetical protein K493DRAFT_312082 [Basidiobolus meristosporus CBS 931.73]|uniref:Uncharacterized protein n=1 Tax=Basidiobolus meristosporus CBS 931.73 TaxID=1314790 RepID=A0A1Y1YWW9_9FUNG|nr:hypothetical protein K493DRAFT_312082 [Basidiobolus meristosporus CBS 931.73]|eukprot:ORY02426.1 hypothetical protein K493DRAFT_312082 [Basidiobolus meristosporus CBS 931.73]
MLTFKDLKRRVSGEYQQMHKPPISAFLYCFNTKSFSSNSFETVSDKSSVSEYDDWVLFKCNPNGIIEDRHSLPNFEDLLNTQQTIHVQLTPRIAI